MTETDLLDAVTDLAGELGLLWIHIPDSRRLAGKRGFPDLVIAGEHGVILAELKNETGDTSAEQDLWGWTLTRAWRAMGAAGHPSGWVVWRPADWHSGSVRVALEEIA